MSFPFRISPRATDRCRWCQLAKTPEEMISQFPGGAVLLSICAECKDKHFRVPEWRRKPRRKEAA